MTKIVYNKEENIIVIHRTGEIHLQDLLTLVDEVTRTCHHKENLYVLDLINQSTSSFQHRDYPVLLKRITSSVAGFNEVRHALVVSKPSDAALSLLYEQLDQSLSNAQFKTFSSMEAAKAWLYSSPGFTHGKTQY